MKRFIILSLTTLSGLLFPVSALASFAPADRQTFQCVTTEACPGPTYVTFNSFTNSPVSDRPSNGDERGFFEAKDASSTSIQSGFSDNVTVHDGQRVMLRVYIHNDANPTLMGVDAAMAHNTAVLVQLPNSYSTSSSATAYISASNAQPRMISDTVGFNASAPFVLSFDRNSAVNDTTRTNEGQGDFATSQQQGVSFSNDYNMSVNLGDWPGGFSRHGMLTFIAVVHMQPAATPASVSCSALDVNSTDSTNSRATVTAHSSVQNANVASYDFVLKDNNGNVLDNSTVNTSASSATYDFNRSQPGTYWVSALITTDKGNGVTSSCLRQLNVLGTAAVTASASSAATPTKAASLPNTGVGDVLGIFTGASSLGAIGHYIVNRRRRC